jgi:quinol-cytochrome oxidoreductase complex cytochrome b subunit
MTDTKKEIIIPPKYRPPYPQGFHRFWPTHAVKSGIVAGVALAVIVVLSVLYRVPTDHNMPPLPDAGTYIPAPEWYLLFVFEPFWYLTGELAVWRQVGTFWIPLAVFVFLLSLPFLFGRKRWPGAVLPKSSKVLLGLGALAFWVVLIAAVIGSGYQTKTTSCISCHTPMKDKRQALPPLDMAKHYREVREMQIALGRHRPDEAEGSESYKDANWQLRHYAEPTEHW